ncbi:hypothetical protein FOA43_002670 [Brettanomyces nanus]|uniref:ER membrane protein complex subunit 7 beta-sandwich domain-containing protein n=1 Tax=Eeniella nana TaxID=13502 RepID=A0A875S2Y4_EENNA|nr:uncharacterized protein FOA43_002670 [Brettanomyces nanus]QPG75318.1 hypothetical protein FOA43_002670 [Brettanomyces nanus]
MLPWILLLFAFSVLALTGHLELPANAINVLDPARASIILIDDSTETQNVYHFLRDGSFNLPVSHKGTYRLFFQSLDFNFIRGNEFSLLVKNSTYYELHEFYSKNKDLVPAGLQFAIDQIHFKNFVDVDPSDSFLNSLPLVPLIRRYPIIGGLLGAGILLMVSPMIISQFDPEFNTKFIDAQKELRTKKSQ